MKTIEEIRLANLTELRNGFPSERQFAIKLNKAPNQVNQWFGKGAARAIQSESAREVEEIMNKPRGWLDNDHSQWERLDADIIRRAVTLAKESHKRTHQGEELEIVLEPETFSQALRTAIALMQRMEAEGDVGSRSRDGSVGTAGGLARPQEDGEAARPAASGTRKRTRAGSGRGD